MYTVAYKGKYFFGDKEGYNEYLARDWTDAYEMYNLIRSWGSRDCYIKDEDNDLYYEDGEWY